MRSVLLLITILAFTSCDTMLSAYYNVNQQETFTSAKAYIDAASKETGLDAGKIVILEQDAFDSMRSDIVKDGLSTFYGIAYKSDIISGNELNIKSCQGQIINLYRAIPDKSAAFSKLDLSSFNYLEGLQFDPEKKTIIILYSYKLGGLTKAKILPVISELQDDPDFDYYVISLDNPDISK